MSLIKLGMKNSTLSISNLLCLLGSINLKLDVGYINLELRGGMGIIEIKLGASRWHFKP